MTRIDKKQIEELKLLADSVAALAGAGAIASGMAHLHDALSELTRLCAIEEAAEAWLSQMVELGCIGPDDGGVVPILRQIIKGEKPNG